MPEPDRQRYLVWRVGDALLAVPIDVVVEAAAMADAAAFDGAEPAAPLPGLAPHGDAAFGVIIDAGGRRQVLPAESIEGVLAAGPEHVTPPPSWLGTPARSRVAGLIRLADERIAAVVDIAALADG